MSSTIDSTQVSDAGTSQPGASEAVRIIDSDAHENIASWEEIFPWLDRHWQRYFTEYGMAHYFQEPKPFGKVGTSQPWEGGSLSTSVDLMERDLIGECGVDIAIINNAAHQFAAKEGWFEFWTAVAHAYNDWQIEHWLADHPRIRGSVNVMPHDPAVAAHEIDRVAEHPQIVQVALPVVMTRQYGDPFYHPIYEAAQRNGLVIALHHGAQTVGATGYGRYFVEWHTTGMPQGMMCQLVSMVVHGVFDKFPSLKVVGLEAGFSWLPSLMSRMDRQYEMFRPEIPWVKRKPSEHFREHVRLATQPMEDFTARQLLNLIDWIGSDEVIMFSSDYPHYDGDMPNATLPGGLPDDIVRKILGENAANTYRNVAQG